MTASVSGSAAVAPPGTASGLDDPRVVRAAQEYLAQAEAGGKPSVAEFVARYPDIAEPLGRCLAGLQFVQAAAPHLSQPLDGVAPSDDGDAVTGTLGDFRIIREVGRGGMGVVYEAEQISLGRRVALKVLPFAATMDPRHLQRFHNEARAAAGLHHMNIVPVYGVGSERGVHYYAMQFIEGHTLAELIAARDSASRGRQPSEAGAAPETQPAAAASTAVMPRDAGYFRRVVEWGIQAAEALEHAHSLGIVHRDVKPANLIVDDWGKLWVTDFGLARTATDAGLTMSGDLLGTLHYMAPEQALARHGLVDHRTDVYSLGATLYELLTGRPAVGGQDRREILSRIADDEPPAPRALDRGVPTDLETIALKSLAKEPAERYATARELADDLRRFLDNRPIQARRPSAAQVASKWARRHQAAVLATGAVLLLAVIALAISAVLIWLEKERTAVALQEKQDALARAEQQQRRAHADFGKALQVFTVGMNKLAAEEGAESPPVARVRELLIANMEEYFRQILQERPDDPYVRLSAAWGHDHLGCDHWQQGKFARAISAYQTAVTIMNERAAEFTANPEYVGMQAESYWRLATALHRVGKWREGRDAYHKCLEYQRRCVQLDPTNWAHLDELAMRLVYCPYEELRDPEEAVRLALRARSVELPDDTSLGTLGGAYFRAGDNEAALVALQAALPWERPTLAYVNFTLVLIRVKRGERAQARRLYDEECERLRKGRAESGRLRENASLEIFWAEAAAALGLEDPAPVPQLD